MRACDRADAVERVAHIGNPVTQRIVHRVLQLSVHSRLEGRIGLGVCIGLFQIEDQRHQRLGDEASAENAEMPALIGAGAEGIGQVWFHRTISSSVARAARIKLRIISGSLMPGELSTPEDTSTPPARVTRTASATLSTLRPPETMKGSLRSRFSSTCQSNTAPSPPGRVAPFGARASNRMASATLA